MLPLFTTTIDIKSNNQDVSFNLRHLTKILQKQPVLYNPSNFTGSKVIRQLTDKEFNGRAWSVSSLFHNKLYSVECASGSCSGDFFKCGPVNSDPDEGGHH